MDSKKLYCPSCGQLAARMKEDSSISYRQYDQLLQKLMELERQGDMELYAGDCPLEDTGAVLDAEQHYTVCHYMRCRRCGARSRDLPGRGSLRCVRVVSGGLFCGCPFRFCHPLRHGRGDFPRCPGRREKEGVNACRFHVPGRFFFDVKIAFFRLNFYICHETCKIEKR